VNAVGFKKKFFVGIVCVLVFVFTPYTAFAQHDMFLTDSAPPIGAEASAPFMPIIPLPDPPAPTPTPLPQPTPRPTPTPPPTTQHMTGFVDIFEFSPLSQRPITRREEGMDILGFAPVIPDEVLEFQHINRHIDDAITQMIGEARRVRARSIRFTHQHYINDHNSIVSIVIFAEVSSVISRSLVQSVNFDRNTGRIVTANEAMGMNVMSLADRILAEKIRSNPGRYYAALSVSMDGQAFYRTDDGIVFLFDEFQLSTTRSGIMRIELSMNNIRQAVLHSAQYHMYEGGYNLRMMPLRTILENQLGYTVEYQLDEISMRVEVWRGSRLVVEMRPDFNEYRIGMMRRSLESAPRVRNGSIYVPITFFDHILPLTTYSIDSHDNSVTFLAYVE